MGVGGKGWRVIHADRHILDVFFIVFFLEYIYIYKYIYIYMHTHIFIYIYKHLKNIDTHSMELGTRLYYYFTMTCVSL